MPLVRVRLYASLREYAPEGFRSEGFTVQLPPASTVADLYARLGLPEEQVKQAFVNGRRAEPDRVLEDGDEVGVFPPIAGGSGEERSWRARRAGVQGGYRRGSPASPRTPGPAQAVRGVDEPVPGRVRSMCEEIVGRARGGYVR